MKCAVRRVLAPVLVLVLVGLRPVMAAIDNPAAAIAAAAGYPAHRHLLGRTSRTQSGATEVWTLEVERAVRLERHCQAELCAGTWFDGARSFAFGMNGTRFHERGSDDGAERTFAAIASTAFAESPFVAAGGSVAALTATGDRLRFAVQAPDGAELVAVADARTQRLVGVERPDGSPYARLVASGTAPALLYAALPYDRVTVLDAALAAPTDPPVQRAAGPEVELLPGPLPIVRCRLADRAATCLLDSGTTPSAMTLGFAERLQREPRGTIEISGLGSYLTGVVDATPLELGQARITDLHFAVIPYARDRDFDVILGADVLGRLRVDFDAAHRRVAIAADTTEPAPESAIALEFGAGLPFADARLAGQTTVRSMLLDTGDAATVSIGYDDYREDPTVFRPRGQSQAGGVSGPAMDTVDGELNALDVGSSHFDRVPVAAVRGQHQGHLGYGWVGRCGRLSLELGQARMRCLASPLDATRPPTGQKRTRS